jgi:hypothetical protein
MASLRRHTVLLAAAAAASCGLLAGCSSGAGSPQHSPSASAPPASAAAPSGQSSSPGQPAATQVITYAPWAAAGTLAAGISASATQSGSCFTTSGATAVSSAYRCMVGNSLHDPCFADAASGAGEVACPDWLNPDSVVIIKLTGSLPAPAASAGSAFPPWLVVLSNGQRCTAITGTGSTLGGMNSEYGCSGGTVYSLPDQNHPAWTVTYAPAGATAADMTQVSVTKAYE